MKLGGWTRLALVVSILLVGMVTAYIALEYYFLGPNKEGDFVQWVPGDPRDAETMNNLFGDCPDSVKSKFSGGCPEEVVWDVKAIQWDRVFLLIASPIAFIWIFIPIVYVVIRWVIAGFKSNSP